MARLRMFASAREAAGTGDAALPGDSVGAVLDGAVERFGSGFADVLATCTVWLNGESAQRTDAVTDADEVAVLPPVSGGA